MVGILVGANLVFALAIFVFSLCVPFYPGDHKDRPYGSGTAIET